MTDKLKKYLIVTLTKCHTNMIALSELISTHFDFLRQRKKKMVCVILMMTWDHQIVYKARHGRIKSDATTKNHDQHCCSRKYSHVQKKIHKKQGESILQLHNSVTYWRSFLACFYLCFYEKVAPSDMISTLCELKVLPKSLQF